jgi:hypothetical protein
MSRTTPTNRFLEMQAYALLGEPVVKIGKRYGISGPSTWKAMHVEEPPSPIQLPYYPEVIALAKDLAVVSVDPEVWNVDAIQKTYDCKHATATKWLLRQSTHLRYMGYRTLMLWKDEVRGTALKHILRYRLGESLVKVGARQCEVIEVPKAEADAFYETYHLQGKANAKYNYALTHPEHGVVAIMAFTHSEACRGASGGWLLQRFASSVVVPGGASRLLSAFRKEHPGFVISYSDERYAPGGAVYATLGFTRDTETPKPDYRYWRGGEWFAKSSKQRRDLISELGGQDPGSTEFEMAASLGYKRCYDLGKITWTLQDTPAPQTCPPPSRDYPIASEHP